MIEEDDYRSMASRFEAVKISMTHDKNGYIIKLAISPDDAPTDLLRDFVGTRYMIAAVRLNLQDEPVPSKDQKEGETAITSAAMLCKDERFWDWLIVTNKLDTADEQSATEYVRERCGVASRSELRTDEKARKRFLVLRAEFTDHLRRSTPG